MQENYSPQPKDKITTAQLAFVIGIERKRIENDIQRDLLPVEPGEGTGKARFWCVDQAVRTAFFYTLRDQFGVDGKLAAEHARNRDLAWRMTEGAPEGRNLWAVYKHWGVSHVEVTTMQQLLNTKFGLSVFPQENRGEGAIKQFVYGLFLIDMLAIEHAVLARWEVWRQHANMANPAGYVSFFNEIGRLNEGFSS